MEAPKNGFFYVIDRDTGKLLSAEKFAKVTWAEKIDPQSGRPVEFPNARYNRGPFMLWPGGGGAHSWQPMAYNSNTRWAYIPVMEMPGLYSDAGIDLAHWTFAPGMVPNIGVRMELAHDVPADAGSSALLAWDPTGQRPVWKVKLPGLWNGGVATTAGNLVFQGQADGEFVARDARTGALLWSFNARAGIVGAPITYRVDGRQYVSVLAGYGGSGAAFGSLAAQFGWDARTQPRRMLTFALDGKATLPPRPPRRPALAVDDPGYQADESAVRRGGVTYGNHCFFCHGAGAIAGGTAPDLRASVAIVSPRLFDTIVRQGVLLEEGMPRFQELTRSELDDLRQYLREQSSELRAAHRHGK
jgi:quinohemoprotein ethanol dehydrogenase